MVDAIGIDAGSYKSVLACVRQKGIEIGSVSYAYTADGYCNLEGVTGLDGLGYQYKYDDKDIH